MVAINSDRMVSVTAAKPKLNALVGDAHEGFITHIVTHGQVAAHLVPASTPIIDDPIAMQYMVSAVIARDTTPEVCARRFTSDGRFTIDGSSGVVRVLGWAWRTDPSTLFMPILSEYIAALSTTAGRALTLADIQSGMAQGLAAGVLSRSEIVAALAYAGEHWHA